jgi:hypothetical protein
MLFCNKERQAEYFFSDILILAARAPGLIIKLRHTAGMNKN